MKVDVKHFFYKMDIEKAKADLKIGSIVEVVIRRGEDSQTGGRKKRKGKVVAKYDDFFDVAVMHNDRLLWEESFHYDELLEDGKVKVLKKGK